MARLGHLYRQGGGEVVRFAARRGPAADPPLFEGRPQRWHLGHQRFRHRRAAGFVLRQALVAPAVGAIFVIKNRHGMGWLAMNDELLQRMQAGIDAGRTLHRMDAADQI